MKRKFKVAAFSLVLAVALAVVLYRPIMQWRYPVKYGDVVERVAKENNLPPELVYAVIHTESSFRPEAVSSVGARGLMQLTEETFEWVQYRMGDTDTVYDDLFQPEVNIQYGGWLLRLLLDEFDTVENTLCAYHAGWGITQRWRRDKDITPDGYQIENIPYKGTAHYQYKVLRAQKNYEKLYG